jgi:hypothetical protein
MCIGIHYNKVAKLMFTKVQMFNGEDPLNILKAAMTRWLSHFLASKTILDRYDDLLDVFTNLFKNMHICERLSEPKILVVFLMMTDILEETNKLSLMLQKNQVNIYAVIERIGTIESFLDRFPESAPVGYYSKAHIFLEKAREYRKESAGFVRQTRGSTCNVEFDLEEFEKSFVRELCVALKGELHGAYNHTKPHCTDN